jgi:hypothetical protein
VKVDQEGGVGLISWKFVPEYRPGNGLCQSCHVSMKVDEENPRRRGDNTLMARIKFVDEI